MTQVSKNIRRMLRDRFGFRTFRPGQEQVVQAALEGRDTVVIMPTGSGKSLCFQLPALALEGTTVVVSPLIALMKDQAEALEERGVEVAAVNSTLSAREQHDAHEAIKRGRSLSTPRPNDWRTQTFSTNSGGPPSTCSSSMRPTASASGAMTFVRLTWHLATPSTASAGRPSSL